MHKTTDSPEDLLFTIAEAQQGYFTAAQAIAAGYRMSNHSYHVKKRHWIREIRGVYRLAKFPVTSDGHYTLWALWSCNRSGEIQGIYSHETALSIYDVSDVMPSKLHMTVPKNFKRGVKIPEILILHRNDLDAKNTDERNGYRITKPAQTVLDIIKESNLEHSLIQQAVTQFQAKGMITKKEILNLIEEYPQAEKYFASKPQKPI